MIKSVSESQEEILNSIKALYFNGKEYECDITYGNGAFWKHIKAPKMKYDITPLKPGVIKADSTNLPISNGVLNNVVYDPPFITYVKAGRLHNSIMSKRFGGYYSYDDLQKNYTETLVEVNRVLKRKGLLVFKCQDLIHNHKMHSTHVNIICWADYFGFNLVDLFILMAKHRMPVLTKMNSNNWTQKHARIFHSYFLVLEKR